MTKRKMTAGIAIVFSVAVLGGWLAYYYLLSPPAVSAQEVVADACDLEDPNFDIVGTIQTPFRDKPVQFTAEVSGKDHHVKLTQGPGTPISEAISLDGVVIERSDIGDEWSPSTMPARGWLARLIGSAYTENIICYPFESTYLVGTEVVKGVETTKYTWAYSARKDEITGGADGDPWTHRWEIWVNEGGQMIQIRTSTKAPDLKELPSSEWDIVTSKIVNVGEENVITKPQS